jgi:uncharacterized RDD family membrane protein YckC
LIELVFLAKVQVSACFCAKKPFFCDSKSTFNSFKIMENLSSYAAVPTNYASFGRRLVAIIIDYILIGAVQFIIIGPILGLLGIGAAANVESFQNMDETQALGMASAMAGAGILLQAIGLAVSGTYFILMESSERQATVGKLAMGIKVTDLNGQRITRMAAFIRFIGKIVSGIILLIGYIMAAFTEKKQALHDIIANTLVLK